MRIALLLLAAAAATGSACGDSPSGGPGDGGPADGGQVGGGLELRFVADPAPPAEIGGPAALELGGIHIELVDLRVIGDAAPGDARTRIDELHLRWPSEASDPMTVRFDDAPPGRYSTVLATIEEYDLRGGLTVGRFDGFQIREERSTIALAIPLAGLTVDADAMASLEIEVRLADLLLSIPWSEFQDDDDDDDEHTVEIDRESDQIGAIRGALGAAFVVAGDDGID